MITTKRPYYLLPGFLARRSLFGLLAGWGFVFGLLRALDVWAPFTTALGFSFLVIVPGLLTVLALRLHQALPSWSEFVLVVAFSLFELMVMGLIGNTALHWFGVDRPLDTPYLFAYILALLVPLGVVAWVRLKEWRLPVIRHWQQVQAWDVGTILGGVLLICLSVFGAISVNNHHANAITFSMLILSVPYAIWLMATATKLRPLTITVALGQLGLALLFATSLRGWLITGHDIQREFFVFTTTKALGRWDIGWYRDAYNACISITILPTIFANMLRISEPYVYKVLFQILFALTPGMVYVVARNYLHKTLAVCAAVLFMAFPTFSNDMPMLIRQEVAFIFLVLLFWLVGERKLSVRLRRVLFGVFGIGMVLSHYSTTYSVIIITGLALGARLIIKHWFVPKSSKRSAERAARRLTATPMLSTSLLLTLLVGSFLWTSVITNTSGGALRVVSKTFEALQHDSKDSRSSDVSIFGGSRVNQEKRVEAYQEETVTTARDSNAAAFYDDDVVGKYPIHAAPDVVSPASALGKLLEYSGKSAKQLNDLLRTLNAFAIQGLIVIGLLYILFTRSYLQERPAIDILALGMASILFIFLQLVLPVLSAEYGLFRAIQQSLMLLGIFIVVGCTVLLPSRFKRYQLWVSPVVVSIFFIVSTGLLPYATGGGRPQLQLENRGVYYDAYYAHEQEVQAANWLSSTIRASSHGDPFGQSVQADLYMFYKVSNYQRFDYAGDVMPGLVRQDSFVLLGQTNVVGRRAVFEQNGDIVTYTFPTEFLDATKDLIYSNGTGAVYK